MSGRIEARVEQKLRCTAAQLYDAWIQPELIRKWLASSLKSIGLTGELRRVETDPRIGGKFCFSDLRNGQEAVHVGEYLELHRPHKIAFTWIVGDVPANELPSQVVLRIASEGNGCVATMVHEMDAKWAEYVSRTEKSWSRMLTAIDQLYLPEAELH